MRKQRDYLSQNLENREEKEKSKYNSLARERKIWVISFQDFLETETLVNDWCVQYPITNIFGSMYCIQYKWAIISKTSGTDAVFAQKTIPRMRFYQVLTLWTCFPCMFDMSTMSKLLKLVLDIWGRQFRTFFEIIAQIHYFFPSITGFWRFMPRSRSKYMVIGNSKNG